MTHDFQQYEDSDAVESLQYLVSCEDSDCEWINRRSSMQAAKNSQRHHESKNLDHDVKIENDGGPFTESDDE